MGDTANEANNGPAETTDKTTDDAQGARGDQSQQDQEQEGTETEPKDLAAELEKWKNLSRKNEETAKKNAEAAKRWQEFEESRKTEDQKRDEEHQRILAERDEATRRAALYEAATTHGLTPEDLELLDGVPADQLTERAEKLAARLKPARKPSPSTGIGRETPPGAGSTGDWLRDALRSS